MGGARLSGEGAAHAAPAPRVRRARPGEAALLAHFAAEAFTATYAPHSRAEDVAAYVDAHLTPAAFAADLADPALATLATLVAVAEPADGAPAAEAPAIVGYAQLRVGDAWPADARWTHALPADGAQLARLYVAPAAHGGGLAARLLAATGALAAAAGARTLWLCVWQGNARALAFYRKHGFAPVGTATFVMGAEVQDDWILARPLAAADGGLPGA